MHNGTTVIKATKIQIVILYTLKFTERTRSIQSSSPGMEFDDEKSSKPQNIGSPSDHQSQMCSQDMGLFWSGCHCCRKEEEEENDAEILGVNSYAPGVAPSGTTRFSERRFSVFDNAPETAVERSFKDESMKEIYYHIGADISTVVHQRDQVQIPE